MLRFQVHSPKHKRYVPPRIDGKRLKTKWKQILNTPRQVNASRQGLQLTKKRQGRGRRRHRKRKRKERKNKHPQQREIVRPSWPIGKMCPEPEPLITSPVHKRAAACITGPCAQSSRPLHYNRGLALWQWWIEVCPVACSWERALSWRALEGPGSSPGQRERRRQQLGSLCPELWFDVKEPRRCPRRLEA